MGMTEERFEEFLKRTLDDLDPVPPTPREELWASIQQQRRFAKRKPVQHAYNVWVRWGVGIAATLAIGVGIGRYSASNKLPDERPRVAVAPAPVNRTAYKLTVAEHLTSAEALLTSFRTQPRGALDPEIAVWARDLLTNTRLLLDSPAGDDPNVAALLEDLELIIAQIARMSAPSKEENAIIRDGMNKTAVLPRLRATLPAGTAAAGT
jgi:hypothetical protein